ncbi:hypothetical protein PMIN01_03729 [Paraphaeosphaeria minitans]|uniref:Uncharacterized protein n=1 Tax=Paraphaeosphaeria minitans TaxID=565426 RepID=A0A9P6KTZ4_9PLEO|nr:hypothetical protein PMIN01_03729 [Paraphaeosphaeria minitans]
MSISRCGHRSPRMPLSCDPVDSVASRPLAATAGRTTIAVVQLTGPSQPRWFPYQNITWTGARCKQCLASHNLPVRSSQSRTVPQPPLPYVARITVATPVTFTPHIQNTRYH